MSESDKRFALPSFALVTQALAPLNVSLSASWLHGYLCAYLCSGALDAGERYLEALFHAPNAKPSKESIRCLFRLLACSQQQLDEDDFSFRLLLPDDAAAPAIRAEALSQWCEGFTHNLKNTGLDIDALADDDANEALEHLELFAQIDYASVGGKEDDEAAFIEVSEFTKLSVLCLFYALRLRYDRKQQTTH